MKRLLARLLGIRWKLIFWPSLLLALTGGGLIFHQYQLSQRHAEALQQELAGFSRRIADRLFELNADRLLMLANGVLSDPRVRNGFLRRDAPALETVLEKMSADLVFNHGVHAVELFDLSGKRVGMWGEREAALDEARVPAGVWPAQPYLANVACGLRCEYYFVAPLLLDGRTQGSIVLVSTLESIVLDLRRMADVGVLVTRRPAADAPRQVEISAGSPVDSAGLDLALHQDSDTELVQQGRVFRIAQLALPVLGGQGDPMLLIVRDVTRESRQIRGELRRNLLLTFGALLASMLFMNLMLNAVLRRIRRLGRALPLMAEERFLEVRKLLHGGGGRVPDELDRIDGAVVDVAIRLERLIDERRRQSADLQAQSSQLEYERDFVRCLLAALPVIIFQSDSEGKVRMANDAAGHLLGGPARHLIGSDFSARFLGRQAAGLLERVQAQGTVTEESRVIRADGQTVEIAWSHVLLEMGRDGPVFLSVGTDVTEYRAMASELALAEQQRETLVREVHHRIKNNLQGVAGFLVLYADQHPSVNAVLQDVIGKIKSVSIIFGLQGRQSSSTVFLDDVVGELCNANEDIQRRRIVYVQTLDPAGRLALETGKSVSIALVINELMTNAIKHGGQFRAPVEVILHEQDGEARVSVRNQAPSMPPDFDFEQGRGVGTGLSLARFMLPRSGAKLVFTHEDGMLTAELSLKAPAVYIRRIQG